MAGLSRADRKAAMKNRQKASAANAGKSGFGKRYLNLEGYKDVKFFKPKTKGKNIIDIIPYIVTTKNHPQKIKPDYEDYILDIYVHKNVGPGDDQFICLKSTFQKACPICEQKAVLEKSGKKDEADLLKPKHRGIYNIIDLDNEDDGIQIFDSTHYFFEKEVMEELESEFEDEEVPVLADIEEGLTITFKAKEETYGKAKFQKFRSFTFDEREEPYGEEILDEAYPLEAMLVIPTYAEVEAAFYGNDDPVEGEDSTEEKPKAEKPKRGRGSRKKKEEVPKEEVEAEPGEIVEETPKADKSKRSRKPRAAKKEVEVVEEELSCPVEDLDFGDDFDSDDACDKCDLFDKCYKAYNALS